MVLSAVPQSCSWCCLMPSVPAAYRKETLGKEPKQADEELALCPQTLS